MHKAVVAIAMFTAMVTATITAHADDELARARQLEASLEYDQALAIVDNLLARGGSEPARYVELHVLAGRLAAGLEKPQIAEDHFARALAVRPDTRLPDGTSPKLTEPFAAAQARAQPLRVEVTSARGVVAITATDRVGIVVGIAATVVDSAGSGARREIVDRGALRLAIPDGTRAIEVAALDASGNHVWVGAPPAESTTVAPAVTGPRHHAFYARASTWAIATGVVLAGAGFAAWRFDVDQREWNRLRDGGTADFTELQALETRGRRWGLAANIGLGVALAAGVTTGVLWLRNRSSSSVVVAPGPGGVAVSGRF